MIFNGLWRCINAGNGLRWLPQDCLWYICIIMTHVTAKTFSGIWRLSSSTAACISQQSDQELHFPLLCHYNSMLPYRRQCSFCLVWSHRLIGIYTVCIWPSKSLWCCVSHNYICDMPLGICASIAPDQPDLRALLSADKSMKPSFTEKWTV